MNKFKILALSRKKKIYCTDNVLNPLKLTQVKLVNKNIKVNNNHCYKQLL